jgi:hypothetical protein
MGIGAALFFVAVFVIWICCSVFANADRWTPVPEKETLPEARTRRCGGRHQRSAKRRKGEASL